MADGAWNFWMALLPTNPQRESCQGIGDYELKASITPRFSGGAELARPLWS